MLKLQTLPSPSTTSQEPFIGAIEFGVSFETHDWRLWQREAIQRAFKHDKISEKYEYVSMLRVLIKFSLIIFEEIL